MSKGTKGRAYHMRWLPDEWLKVAVMALGLIEGEQDGQAKWTALEAVDASQRAVLPPHRWRDTVDLKRQIVAHPSVWPKVLGHAMSMTHEEREAVLLKQISSPPGTHKEPESEAPPPAPAPEAQPVTPKPPRLRGKNSAIPDGPHDKGANGVVRWTRREWALIARGAKWNAENRSAIFPTLWEQVADAQSWVLAPERRRPRNSIYQSMFSKVTNGKTGNALPALIAEALNHLWEVEAIPFYPPGTMPPAPPAPEPTEEAAAPVAAPTEPQATQAPPAQRSTLAEAAKAFGETIMGALDKLLATHSAVLLDQVNARLSESADDIGKQVSALLSSSLPRIVHSVMESELGGPINPPAVPADEPAGADAPIPGEVAPRKARIKVDIVGEINAPVKTTIQGNFRGDDVDLRFFDGNFTRGYHPTEGRHCLLITDRISHQTHNSIRKCGVQPIYVKPTAALITNAIEELQRSAMQ